IYVGGAGAAIIGGLYWKKGTTAGAWSALLTGSTLATGGILIRQFYPDFPLNGMQISFYATLIAIAVYIVVSLLTNRVDFNLDRMLHRGAYSAVQELPGDSGSLISSAHKKPSIWAVIIGIDENFTTGDKWLTCSLFAWTTGWFFVAAIGVIWNFIIPWPPSVWSAFWRVVGIGIPIVMAVVTAFWFTWGGIRDIRALFRRLAREKVNHLDDGSVVNHQNLDEAVAVQDSKDDIQPPVH
ncbi:MAG: hypothetical protein WCH43_14655, partial [Verrucomicrobiota bacterium]